MDSHVLWQLFLLTGLPQAYALAKALEGLEAGEATGKSA